MMNKPWFHIFAAICMVLMCVLTCARTPALASGKSDFTRVVDNLDLSKNTSLHVKTYWKKMAGTPVTMTAIVRDVSGGRGKARILAVNKSRRSYKGYNLVLVTYDVDAAADLHIGERIKFKGELLKYKSRKGNPVILYLDNVELIRH